MIPVDAACLDQPRESSLVQIIVRDNPASPPERVEVDLRDPPPVVRPAQHPGLTAALSLDWDRALDDNRHLRRCPVCRCEDLYVRNPVPRMTAFILIVLAAAVAMVLYGIDLEGWAIGALLVVLLIDLTILLVSRPALVCYRCKTQYRRLKIPRAQPRWDAAVAERYRREQARSAGAEPASG